MPGPKPKILLTIDIRAHFHPVKGYPHWLISKEYWQEFYRQKIAQLRGAGFDVEVACLRKPTSFREPGVEAIPADFHELFVGATDVAILSCKSRRDNSDFIRRYADARGVTIPNVIVIDQWPAELARAAALGMQTVSLQETSHPYHYPEFPRREVTRRAVTLRADRLGVNEEFVAVALVEHGGDIYVEPHFDLRTANRKGDSGHAKKSSVKTDVDFTCSMLKSVWPHLLSTIDERQQAIHRELLKASSDLPAIKATLAFVNNKLMYLDNIYEQLKGRLKRLSMRYGVADEKLAEAHEILQQLAEQLDHWLTWSIYFELRYEIKIIDSYKLNEINIGEVAGEVARLEGLADDELLGEFTKEKQDELSMDESLVTAENKLRQAKAAYEILNNNYRLLRDKFKVPRRRLKDERTRLNELKALIDSKQGAVNELRDKIKALKVRQAMNIIKRAIDEIDWSASVSSFGSFSKIDGVSFPAGVKALYDVITVDGGLASVITTARQRAQGGSYGSFFGGRDPQTQRFYRLVAGLVDADGNVDVAKLEELRCFVERNKDLDYEGPIKRSRRSSGSTVVDSDADEEGGVDPLDGRLSSELARPLLST